MKILKIRPNRDGTWSVVEWAARGGAMIDTILATFEDMKDASAFIFQRN